MLKDTRNTDNSGIRFISRFTMNNIARKLQKCWTHKIAFKIISKVLKQPNFFYSQPSTLPKEAPAKFYLSTTFGLSFMISSVAPTRSSISSADLITKIGNHNLKTAQFYKRNQNWKLCSTLSRLSLNLYLSADKLPEAKKLRILICNSYFDCDLMATKLCTVKELANMYEKLKLKFL